MVVAPGSAPPARRTARRTSRWCGSRPRVPGDRRPTPTGVNVIAQGAGGYFRGKATEGSGGALASGAGGCGGWRRGVARHRASSSSNGAAATAASWSIDSSGPAHAVRRHGRGRRGRGGWRREARRVTLAASAGALGRARGLRSRRRRGRCESSKLSIEGAAGSGARLRLPRPRDPRLHEGRSVAQRAGDLPRAHAAQTGRARRRSPGHADHRARVQPHRTLC